MAETAKTMGIETAARRAPGRGPRGLRFGVSPLEMANAYATLAYGGIHRQPIAIREGRVPRRPHRPPRAGRARTRLLRGRGLRGDADPPRQHRPRAPAPRAYTGCYGQAGKTARPTTTPTPGSSATSQTLDRRLGRLSGAQPDLHDSVHGITVAGGTFPAEIWNNFMSIALDKYGCSYFPEPENPMDWIPFHGSYTSDSSYSSCSGEGSYGSGTSEGAYGCEVEEVEVETDEDKDSGDDGAYAPGRGQKPLPPPQAPARAAAPPPPPPPPPPSGGTTP